MLDLKSHRYFTKNKGADFLYQIHKLKILGPSLVSLEKLFIFFI